MNAVLNYRSEGEGVSDWARALGYELDPQQLAVFNGDIRRGILNCCRQWGKSTTIGLKAAHFAVTQPGKTVLVVAPSARQSENLLAIVGRILQRLEIPAKFTQERIQLANGSRIVALPNQPTTIRGFSPDLLVVDEAAFLPEEIWEAIFPMLNAAPGGGLLWLMSTPSQPVGFFHRLWTDGSREWTRLKVTAPECPRISAQTLAEAKRSLAPEHFAREYLCEFTQAPTAAFPEEMVKACLDPSLPEFLTSPLVYPMPAAPYKARPHSYLGLDLGKSQDPSAIVVAEFTTTPTHTVDPATRAPLFRCSLALRHLESPRLGTQYQEVANRALVLAAHARMNGHCTVVVDASGVGAPVVEQMKRPPVPAPIVPVVITSGSQVGLVNGNHTVPKMVLMDRLEYVLRLQKLRIALGPLTETLVRQLTLLERTERDSGNVTYATAPSMHDDLVMAAALAVWRAWEVHGTYLGAPGAVPIVSDAGVFDQGFRNPICTPNPMVTRGPRGW